MTRGSVPERRRRHTHQEAGRPARAIAVATFSTVVAVMPAFLVGASGTFLRADLAFGAAELGRAVAVFFGANAIFSSWGGRFSEHVGSRRALMLACAGSGATMLAIALVANSLAPLLLLLAVAGCLNGIAQPATNLALVQLDPARPALVFGVKQAAIPLATLIAGASVPLVSLTVGWRWAFVMGALVALIAAIAVPDDLDGVVSVPSVRVRHGDAATGPLVALAVATGIGTAAAVALGSFLVEAAVDSGMAVGVAGWLLVAGSLGGVVGRIGVGLLADRRRGLALYVVSVLLTIGAGGYALMAARAPVAFAVGAMIAYTCGWGWGGLLNFAIVRFNPNAPALASGIVLTGAAGGATVGPFVFGTLVATTSFQVGWSAAAVAAVLSAALVIAARSWLVRDETRRQQLMRADQS